MSITLIIPKIINWNNYQADVNCGKVLPVLNGAVDYANDTTHLGSEITYSCTRNYRLNGVSRRYCLDNGQWSDATPKCEGNYIGTK